MRDRFSERVLMRAVVLIVLLLSGAASAQDRIVLTAGEGEPRAATFSAAKGDVKGGVVAIPAAKSTRAAFDPLLPRLAAAGITTVVVEPRPALAGGVESAPTDHVTPARQDVNAALEYLAEHGVPADKVALIGSEAGALVALEHAGATGARVKALVLLSPGRDAPVPASVLELTPRPLLLLATKDPADKGAHALELALPWAEVHLHDDRLAFGTGMFGRVTGGEALIVDWLGRALAQPATIEIHESKLVLTDGDLTAPEAEGATIVSAPLGNEQTATIRLSRSRRSLDIGFDIPEPYVRLNEVVIYIDPSGKGGRNVDGCYRVSFNPKNPARKPVLVQKGTIAGFEDSDDKGVIAFARTEEKKRRWTAELSLDLARFLPGELPRNARLAFQINGQRTTDIRYQPDDAKVPTTPGSWSVVRVL